jgi:hypothetical protein
VTDVKEDAMQDSTKLGAAAIGGYVLGRTKKAKAAIGLALWLTGRRHVGDFVRTEARHWIESDQAHELVESGRDAALSVFEAQAVRLGDALARRAEAIDGGDHPAAHDDDNPADDRGDDEYDEYDDEYDEDDAPRSREPARSGRSR